MEARLAQGLRARYPSQMTSLTWQEIRRNFPSTESSIHFNHAGISPISNKVVKAVTEFLDHLSHFTQEKHEQYEARIEDFRAAYAKLIGAEAGEIAFTKNTSEGLSLVAAGLDWQAGDNVIAVDGEYPSNVYPWWSLRRLGVETTMVTRKGPFTSLADIQSVAKDRTRLVALSFVDWATGGRSAIEEIGDWCQSHNILLCVDGIQGVGAIPIDVHKAKIDFMSVGSHKWLLSPEGCGALFISRRVLDRLRPVLWGWNSVKSADEYLPYHFDPRNDAARFEPGSASILSVLAFGTSIEWLLEIGTMAIEERIFHLGDLLADGLGARGLEIISPREHERRSGILVFRPSGNPEELMQKLAEEKVVVRVRSGGIRLAPHFYNDESDISGFFSALDRLA